MSCPITTDGEPAVIGCPGPAFDICALQGVGSQEIVITYPTVTPIDLTTHTAKFTVRDHTGTTKFELTSASGRITLGSSTGNIRFRVRSTDLTGASMGLGDYPFSLVLTPPAGEDFVAGRGVLSYKA